MVLINVKKCARKWANVWCYRINKYLFYVLFLINDYHEINKLKKIIEFR